jgi:hypothetical protein
VTSVIENKNCGSYQNFREVEEWSVLSVLLDVVMVEMMMMMIIIGTTRRVI